MIDLEHHQLILRYEHLRLRCPDRERRLLASLAERGQQMPIVVVAAEQADRYVVVDGYKRIRALRRLGQDTLRAACWELSELEAVLLGRLIGRGIEESAFEQGLLLEELQRRFSLTLGELARRFDRTPSWVSRRLALVGDLPEPVQQRVLRGELVPHAAMRSLVPLARANRGECERLVEAIAGRDLTSRQIGELVTAYRGGGAKTRALVLADPLLVLRARQEGRRASVCEPPAPCAELHRDFELLAAVARRAFKRLSEGAALVLAPAEREELSDRFSQAERAMDRLARQMRKEIDDARPTAANGRPSASSPGVGAPGDRPGDGHRPGDGAPDPPVGVGRTAAPASGGEGRAASRQDPGASRFLQREPRAGA